jgi:hypothetical protein
VYAYVFRLPSECTRSPIKDAASVCASPGGRSLLGSLVVSRSEGAPEVVSTDIEGTGTGVLCVDNGFEASPATAGWVWLGAGLQVGPDEFHQDVTRVARKVPLQGRRALSAQVAGGPGSGFRVRLYGEMTCDVGLKEGPSQGTEVRYGQLVPAGLEAMREKAVFTRYFVPSGYEGQLVQGGGSEGSNGVPDDHGAVPDEGSPRVGCSAAGGPVALLGLWMLSALLLRDRGAVRARRHAASRR